MEWFLAAHARPWGQQWVLIGLTASKLLGPTGANQLADCRHIGVSPDLMGPSGFNTSGSMFAVCDFYYWPDHYLHRSI